MTLLTHIHVTNNFGQYLTCTCWWNCLENQHTNSQLGLHLLALIRVGLSQWVLTTFYWSCVFICLDPSWTSPNCHWTDTFGPDVTLMWTKCIDYIHIHKLESSYLMLLCPVVLTVNRSFTLDCCRATSANPVWSSNVKRKQENECSGGRVCNEYQLCPSQGIRCCLVHSLLCQPVQV